MQIFSTIALACGWLVMFAATHAPSLPKAAARVPDKAMHSTAYLVLAVLLAFWVAVRWRLTVRRLGITLLVLLAYGAVDEITQSFIPGRNADWQDWLADGAGAVIGLALFAAVWRLWKGVRGDSRSAVSEQ